MKKIRIVCPSPVKPVCFCLIFEKRSNSFFSAPLEKQNKPGTIPGKGWFPAYLLDCLQKRPWSSNWWVCLHPRPVQSNFFVVFFVFSCYPIVGFYFEERVRTCSQLGNKFPSSKMFYDSLINLSQVGTKLKSSARMLRNPSGRLRVLPLLFSLFFAPRKETGYEKLNS